MNPRDFCTLFLNLRQKHFTKHAKRSEFLSLKKTILNDLSICKILARWDLHMIINERCGIDAFLTKSCQAVVQGLYLVSLKVTVSAYQTEMACS
jgi:hypothetical protein